MALITILALVLGINAVARRWGVDSRDGCDWGSHRSSHCSTR